MSRADPRNEQLARRRLLLLVAERAVGAPDEGYIRFTSEIAGALQNRVPLLVDTGGGGNASYFPIRGLVQTIHLIRSVRRQQVGKVRPGVILYLSRSSTTLAALLRAKLLKVLGWPAAVVMIALQPRELSRLARVLVRSLWPDLLLVGTEAEREMAKSLGATVECISGGVDLSRFRPARPLEKADLRAAWGLPLDRSIILHVGHLRSGRNLERLIPLAKVPGITVVVAASRHRGPETPRLTQTLRAGGVLVLESYFPNIDELYRLADCYAFPTHSTDSAIATPLSILEAMATNLPVASMRIGALAERFGNTDGLRLVDTGDELVEAVLQLVGRRANTVELALPYSWDAIAERLLRLIDAAVG